jgi:hypothetical protein
MAQAKAVLAVGAKMAGCGKPDSAALGMRMAFRAELVTVVTEP